MVPHLITALTGPINELEQRVLDSMPAIERWFRLEWMEHTPPFYTSVDIRNAGFKLAPVDTNLYPGGWNNLTPQMLPLAVQSAMAAIEKICPEAKNLLVIPENHTRNTFYLSNLAQLQRIFHMAGLNVRIGSINPEIKAPTVVDLPNGDQITLEPMAPKVRAASEDLDADTKRPLYAGSSADGAPLLRDRYCAPAHCTAHGVLQRSNEDAPPRRPISRRFQRRGRSLPAHSWRPAWRVGR